MRCTSQIADAPELRKVEGTDHISATNVPDGVHQLHELHHFLLRPLIQTRCLFSYKVIKNFRPTQQLSNTQSDLLIGSLALKQRTLQILLLSVKLHAKLSPVLMLLDLPSVFDHQPQDSLVHSHKSDGTESHTTAWQSLSAYLEAVISGDMEVNDISFIQIVPWCPTRLSAGPLLFFQQVIL